MSKKYGCSCRNTLSQSDFLLLDHHPSCKMFDPGKELYKLEHQCMSFYYELRKYKELYQEEKKHREEVEKILTQQHDIA